MDEFEQELRGALERRPAPPGLKRRVMEQRNARRAKRSWWGSLFAMPHGGVWRKVAAMLLIAVAVGGGVEWREKQVEEQRKGEAARQQVMTALRITGHALNTVQARLAAHDRGGE
jgi:hypothetical protein